MFLGYGAGKAEAGEKVKQRVWLINQSPHTEQLTKILESGNLSKSWV